MESEESNSSSDEVGAEKADVPRASEGPPSAPAKPSDEVGGEKADVPRASEGPPGDAPTPSDEVGGEKADVPRASEGPPGDAPTPSDEVGGEKADVPRASEGPPSDAPTPSDEVGGEKADAPRASEGPPGAAPSIAGRKKISAYDEEDRLVSSEDDTVSTYNSADSEDEETEKSASSSSLLPLSRKRPTTRDSANTKRTKPNDSVAKSPETSQQSQQQTTLPPPPIPALPPPPVKYVDPTFIETGRRVRKYGGPYGLAAFKPGDSLVASNASIVGTVLNFEAPTLKARAQKTGKLWLLMDDKVVIDIRASGVELAERMMAFAVITQRLELRDLTCAKEGPKKWVWEEGTFGRFHPPKEKLRAPTLNDLGGLKDVPNRQLATECHLSLLTAFNKKVPIVTNEQRRYNNWHTVSIVGEAAVRDSSNHRGVVQAVWDESLTEFGVGASIRIDTASVNVRHSLTVLHTRAGNIRADNTQYSKLEIGGQWLDLKTRE